MQQCFLPFLDKANFQMYTVEFPMFYGNKLMEATTFFG